MAAFAAQIRGNYVVGFTTLAAVPAFQDVITAPPSPLRDGDVIVIIDGAPTPPVIVAQGIYSHPEPIVTAISGPLT